MLRAETREEEEKKMKEGKNHEWQQQHTHNKRVSLLCVCFNMREKERVSEMKL